MRSRIHDTLCLLLLATTWSGIELTCRAAESSEKASVIFLNIDDWNDWNSVLKGHPQAITPNIQRLADRGVAFTNAICSSPTCFPSRSAVFTGIHPARSGNIVNDNGIHPWRFYGRDAVTLPKHLSAHGWTSIGIGKNFHKGNDTEFDTYLPKPRSRPQQVPGIGLNLNPSGHWGVFDGPVTEMADYIAVSRGIEMLDSVTDPLFLSLGIYRPHVPWVVPQEYFDRYPLEAIQLPDSEPNDLDDLPQRFQRLAHLEAKFGPGYHEGLVEKGHDKQFIRAYLACVTFADEQIGRLLDAWDASPHAEGGYIVLWSDHGYNLGEKEAWSKMKPWYDSAHCNLIVAGPGIPEGITCDKAVSLQDLYPTLVELLQLAPPSHSLDGNSLVPLLNAPQSEWDRPVVMSSETDGIRYDVVLDNDYRMTRLITGETELYELASDPHEFTNLAPDPQYAPLVDRLSEHLTFSYPEIPEDGWIEAESIPAQTSSDFKLRGNCHYQRADPEASGGQLLCAELRAGKGSYLDLVLDVPTTGTFQLGATLSVERPCQVFVDAIVDDATQADTGYPMTAVGTVNPGSDELEDKIIGTVTLDSPGLKILRFQSLVPKQQMRIDRILLKPQSSN